MRIFEIDFKSYAIELIPPFLRGGIFTAFALAVVDPVIETYKDFLSQRRQNLIRMNFTYQKFSIERRINDVFDPGERRLKIVKAVQYEGVYLYTEAEDDSFHSKTKWLNNENPIYLRTDAELYSEFDFIVQIPNIGIDQIRLKAEIDFYKLISKRYQIVII